MYPRTKCPPALIGLALVGICGPGQAEWACEPPPGPGPADLYELTVEPFEKAYRFETRLRVPLSAPRVEQVSIGKFLVVVEERQDPSVGPGGPLDLGGALAEAYRAAAREPDRLKEFFYRQGRDLFDRACGDRLQTTMQQEGLRVKTVDFLSPAEGDSLAGTRHLGDCIIPTSEGRYVLARLFFQREAHEVRRTHRNAGKAVARFTLSATGQVGDDPQRTIEVSYQVTAGPEVSAEHIPEDLAENIARAAAAAYIPRVERKLAEILRELNDKPIHLEPPQQAELCRDDGGRSTEPMPFTFYRDQADADLTITAVKRRVINEALGDPCDLIDCDCEHIEAGLLTRPWRSACRGEEASARAHCRETGQIRRCHMVGPNPSYPD